MFNTFIALFVILGLSSIYLLLFSFFPTQLESWGVFLDQRFDFSNVLLFILFSSVIYFFHATRKHTSQKAKVRVKNENKRF